MGHLLTASLKSILCAVHAKPSAGECYLLMPYYRSEAHPCQVNRKKSPRHTRSNTGLVLACLLVQDVILIRTGAST